MLVTGYYHDGVIELPKKYQLFKNNSNIQIEIVEEEIDLEKFPYMKEKMEKIKAIRHWNGSYIDSGKSDNELHMEGILMKYPQGEK